MTCVYTTPAPSQGSPQFVSIELPYSACVSRVHIRFQGGFASTHCILASGSEQHSFYPEDINSLQVAMVIVYTGARLCPVCVCS